MDNSKIGSSSPIDRSPVEGCRVLVAEDDEVSLLLAIAFLRRLGCVVEGVRDGIAATDVLTDCHFDLALMDVHMPLMDGLQATRHVRRAEKVSGQHVPIIALTGGGMPDELLACADAGMDDVLLKPLDQVELANVVRKWCAGCGSAKVENSTEQSSGR